MKHKTAILFSFIWVIYLFASAQTTFAFDYNRLLPMLQNEHLTQTQVYVLQRILGINLAPLLSAFQSTETEPEVNPIFSEFKYILKKGLRDRDTGGEVSKLQRFLQDEGTNPGAVDGSYRQQTAAAVNRLKEKYTISDSPEDIFNPSDFLTDNKVREMSMFLASDEVFFYRLPRVDDSRIECNEKEARTLTKGKDDEKIFFPITFPDTKRKSVFCVLATDESEQKFLTIYKKEKQKPISHSSLKVSNIFSKIGQAASVRIAIERNKLAKTYKKNKDVPPLFSKSFQLPMDTAITAPFGQVRIINGSRSVHSGTDFRARTPLPIRSVNDGIVVLAENLFYCGKTVIVNHGADLFAIYCHLSDIDVEVDDRVSRGDVIGLTGATGRVSGPHLHLSEKFQGKNVDFMTIYENSKILGE